MQPSRNQGDRPHLTMGRVFLEGCHRGGSQCYDHVSFPLVYLLYFATHPVSGSFKNGRAANAVATKGTKRVKERILKRVAEFCEKNQETTQVSWQVVKNAE